MPLLLAGSGTILAQPEILPLTTLPALPDPGWIGGQNY